MNAAAADTPPPADLAELLDTPAHRHRVEAGAAIAWFSLYALKINAGRIAEAAEARNALLALGFEVIWRPRPPGQDPPPA